jgi:SAM-dependent methyltransferase
MPDDLKTRTISDFGRQWTNFRDNPGYYGSVEFLSDFFGPLLSVEAIRGLRVADIGSGTGRIVGMLLDAGAQHVVAVEPSAAMSVLTENTASRRDRISYIHDGGDALPQGLGLDLVVSFGVLHHIPDPGPVVRAAYDALRPGGQLLIWLYGREGNEAYLHIAEPLRRLTTRLPHPVLSALSTAGGWALTAYLGACRILPLPMHRYMTEVLGKLPQSVRKLTVYDQLNPAYSKYYRKSEAEDLVRTAGFANVTSYHRHGYSWTVIGTKSPTCGPAPS